MRRGDVVIAAAQGDYGKPRPAVVVQTDLLADSDSISLAMTTTTLIGNPDLRPVIEPSVSNGLRQVSEVMIDKVQPVRRTKVDGVIGRLSDADLERVSRSLAFFFGLAD